MKINIPYEIACNQDDLASELHRKLAHEVTNVRVVVDDEMYEMGFYHGHGDVVISDDDEPVNESHQLVIDWLKANEFTSVRFYEDH